jgi:hypothetical protein
LAARHCKVHEHEIAVFPTSLQLAGRQGVARSRVIAWQLTLHGKTYLNTLR